MAKTDSKTNDKTAAPEQAPPAQLPATISLRLLYPKSAQDYFGIGQSEWIVLTDVIFPNATSPASVLLALRYCKARSLDVMKKVVNIVPMYSKALGKMVDTIWPGIAEVRITAVRTGAYAGRDAEEFGGLIMKTFDKSKGEGKEKPTVDVEYPEWCSLTVYKIVAGQRCAFVGPKVYWEEAYATESRYSKAPNEMWSDRSRGQLSKCAEAAALRAAFPEETGGQMTAEEMHGRVIDGALDTNTMVVQDDIIVPPRPKQSDFARDEVPKAPVKKPELEIINGPDGRPEPPPIGEIIENQNEPEPEAEEGADQPPVIVETNDDEDETPTEAYMSASNSLDTVEAGITSAKDLDQVKREGRAHIDQHEGLTDDERDMLRGRFTTMILSEQQRRAKKKR